MEKIAADNRIKQLIKEKIAGTPVKQVELASIQKFGKYLDDVANQVALEAANSNYFKVKPLDIERGIEKVKLLTIKQYLDNHDTYISLRIETEEKLKRIDGVLSSE